MGCRFLAWFSAPVPACSAAERAFRITTSQRSSIDTFLCDTIWFHRLFLAVIPEHLLGFPQLDRLHGRRNEIYSITKA
jgi:hypothetical protein